MYGPTVVDHFSHPRNVGRIEDADGVGRVDDRGSDNLITIYVKLDGRRIGAARFRTLGCSACVAASSVATELVAGRSPDEALAIDAGAILTALGGLPADKQHCAELAAHALQLALEQALEIAVRS